MTTLAKKQMRAKGQKTRAEREGLDPKVLGEYERAPSGNPSVTFMKGVIDAANAPKKPFEGARKAGRAASGVDAAALPPLGDAWRVGKGKATEFSGTVEEMRAPFDRPIRPDWLNPMEDDISEPPRQQLEVPPGFKVFGRRGGNKK